METLSPLNTTSPFSPPPAPGSHPSAFYLHEFTCFSPSSKWNSTVFVFLCLVSLTEWNVFRVHPCCSRCQNFLPTYRLSNIPLCGETTFCVYVHLDTSGLDIWVVSTSWLPWIMLFRTWVCKYRLGIQAIYFLEYSPPPELELLVASLWWDPGFAPWQEHPGEQCHVFGASCQDTRGRSLSHSCPYELFKIINWLWLCWVFLATHRLFSTCSEWGPLFSCGAPASQCGGFSCCRVLVSTAEGLQYLRLVGLVAPQCVESSQTRD